MKNLYIPKGKTLHYETLYCQNIVNDGTLIVDGTLHARSISGKGILKAGTVSVRHVAEMDIECATMNGETLMERQGKYTQMWNSYMESISWKIRAGKGGAIE